MLFVFGVLIAWAMLQLFGVLDPFTQAVTLEYIDFLLRVGFAGLVIANADTLVDEGDDAAADGLDGDGPTAGSDPDPGAAATAD